MLKVFSHKFLRLSSTFCPLCLYSCCSLFRLATTL
nr:MAG TPA: hypothetical protein [Caudoviricetes sp.]